MTPEQLAQLKVRATQALSKGFQMAYIESYIADLGGGPAPAEIAPKSIEHLLHLISLAEKGGAAPKAEAPKAAEPEAPKAEAVVEPVPKAEEAPAVAEAPVEPAAPVAAPKSKKSKKS